MPSTQPQLLTQQNPQPPGLPGAGSTGAASDLSTRVWRYANSCWRVIGNSPKAGYYILYYISIDSKNWNMGLGPFMLVFLLLKSLADSSRNFRPDDVHFKLLQEATNTATNPCGWASNRVSVARLRNYHTLARSRAISTRATISTAPSEWRPVS